MGSYALWYKVTWYVFEKFHSLIKLSRKTTESQWKVEKEACNRITCPPKGKLPFRLEFANFIILHAMSNLLYGYTCCTATLVEPEVEK
jgi:hypothetical protein